MRLAALRTASLVAAFSFVPGAVVYGAQSSTAIPNLPASSWKPEKPIEFVVQSAAGGGSDIFARTMAKILTDEKIVTVPINVVNKPGGSGAIAYSYVNQQKGNPHVIATATSSYLTTPLQGHSPVSFRDFTNIAVLCVEDYVGVVRADSPYKSLKELIAAAKKKPNMIRVGGSSPTSSDGIIRHMLQKVTGSKLNFIVFQSGGEVNAGLLGGTVDFATPNPSEAAELIKADRLRPIAMFSPERLDNWPDVPTAMEQGIDITLEQYRGVVASGGLDKEPSLFWQNAMVKLFQSPGFKKYLDQNGLRPLLKVGEEAEKYLAKQSEFYRETLTELGLIKKK